MMEIVSSRDINIFINKLLYIDLTSFLVRI